MFEIDLKEASYDARDENWDPRGNMPWPIFCLCLLGDCGTPHSWRVHTEYEAGRFKPLAPLFLAPYGVLVGLAGAAGIAGIVVVDTAVGLLGKLRRSAGSAHNAG